MWIIFGHRMDNQQIFPLKNRERLTEMSYQIYSILFTSSLFAVDTFLVLGSVLLSWSMLHALDKKKLNLPRMILHRYLRYTPVLAAMILYFISLNRHLIDGPVTSLNDIFIDNCLKYWWSALIHMQTYVNVESMCLPHSWYLSADFQLFLISPFFIYFAWKFGRKFIWTFPMIALLSSIYLLVATFIYEIQISVRKEGKFGDFFHILYYPTHTRLAPWFIGLQTGFVLYKFKNKKIKISKVVDVAIWILALSMLIAVVVSIKLFALPMNEVSLATNAIYFAFHRVGWSLGLAWVIFACHNIESGGIIRWFLSLPEWQVIARAGLSIYLVHVVYQLVTMMNQKQPFYFEFSSMVRCKMF
jgi:peptidoglycan/LPS O-acetylase OafA/YrhL